jgi:hypothetical protein
MLLFSGSGLKTLPQDLEGSSKYILNKQLQIAYRRWSSTMTAGWEDNRP